MMFTMTTIRTTTKMMLTTMMLTTIMVRVMVTKLVMAVVLAMSKAALAVMAATTATVATTATAAAMAMATVRDREEVWGGGLHFCLENLDLILFISVFCLNLFFRHENLSPDPAAPHSAPPCCRCEINY